jgi:hypothetical protein
MVICRPYCNEMNQVKPQNSYDILWLSIGLVPLILLALLLPLSPHDYWWYLRLGQDVLHLGYVPSVESYSFTQLGEQIINQPWLSAVIFWVTYNAGNLNLTFLLRAICISAAYGLLWYWMRQLGLGPRLSAILIIVAGLSGSNNWSFRPQMFAYPLFVLTLVILWRWQKINNKLLWLLPVIAALWANLHGSFLLIFLLEGAALIFGKGNRKTLGVVTVITFLATLITPYNIQLWTSLAGSFIANSSWDITSEFLPPTNSGWQLNIFYGWVLAFIPLASFSSRRLSTLEWVWLLGLLWMSFSGIRYVIFGIFVLAAFSAYLLADWDLRFLDPPAKITHPILNCVLAGSLLLLSMLALPQLRAGLGVKADPSVVTPDTPIAATNWLSQHPKLRGPLWSDLTFSSYLIFALPTRSVWIDTRFAMVYPTAQYLVYSDIAGAQADWEALLDHDNINLLMISVKSEPNLLAALAVSTLWCKQYQDPVAAIYARTLPGGSCP